MSVDESIGFFKNIVGLIAQLLLDISNIDQ